jgi:hypothetical protein
MSSDMRCVLSHAHCSAETAYGTPPTHLHIGLVRARFSGRDAELKTGV